MHFVLLHNLFAKHNVVGAVAKPGFCFKGFQPQYSVVHLPLLHIVDVTLSMPCTTYSWQINPNTFFINYFYFRRCQWRFHGLGEGHLRHQSNVHLWVERYWKIRVLASTRANHPNRWRNLGFSCHHATRIRHQEINLYIIL